MLTYKKLLAGAGLAVVGALVAVACTSLGTWDLAALPGVSTPAAVPTYAEASEGRKNAARVIDTGGGNMLGFDIRQMDNPATQDRSDPLGLNGFVAWPSIINGYYRFTPGRYHSEDPANPTGVHSEYDWVGIIDFPLAAPDGTETEVCLGIRSTNSNYNSAFTHLEFSLRAVNPWAYGHVQAGPPGNDYFNTLDGCQADFPSNDDEDAQRSLFATAGGDVAILIQGVDFFGVPAVTSSNAYMNYLGPNAWVTFLRDDAYRSGRFYNITGARKGGPPAYYEVPHPWVHPAELGVFESVQVNGDNFDTESEPLANMDPTTWRTCAVPGGPTQEYAFLDRSNLSESDTLSGGGGGPFDHIATPDADDGAGGFLLVIRREAFNLAQVVVNPNVPPVPGGPSAPVGVGDLIPPPPSGYDETIIPAPAMNPLNPSPNDNVNPAAPAGVHEIGFSAFFVHGS